MDGVVIKACATYVPLSIAGDFCGTESLDAFARRIAVRLPVWGAVSRQECRSHYGGQARSGHINPVPALLHSWHTCGIGSDLPRARARGN